MHFLKVERERDGVRLWTQMQREQNNVLSGGREGVGWCQIVDQNVKRAGRHTSWRWRESVMVSDCGPRCKESRMTYQLEVKREHDGVRLKMQMQGEWDNILSEGGEKV